MVRSVLDPDWHVTLSLDSDRRYRFLYLRDDEWNVDDHADAYSADDDGRLYGIVDTALGLGLPGYDRPADPAAAGVRVVASPAREAAPPVFSGWLLAPQTGITYTEFKTAPWAGQIQTVAAAVDPVSGKLAVDRLYCKVRVDDPDLLEDLKANKLSATGQVARRDTGNQRLMSRMPAAS